MLEKKTIKRLHPDVSIVSSNNGSKALLKKKDPGWVTGVFSCANGHKYLYVKAPGFKHTFPCFKTVFFRGSPRLDY